MPPAGRPQTIKLINQTTIREVFMRGDVLTCAEVSAETGISVTTTRATMNQMLAHGEIVSLGTGASTGGRKAEQFVIDYDCYHGLALGVTDHEVHCAVTNIQAEILGTHVAPLPPHRDLTETLVGIIADLLDPKTRAIGIGVPGVVTADGFLRENGPVLKESVDVATGLTRRFGLPLVIENDLRASALGFSRQCGGSSTAVFLHFESSCHQISAGFVEGKRILRGMGNYAGELGLMPYDAQRDFRQALYEAAPSEQTDIIAQLVTWICCVTNPQQIMLCSDGGLVMDATIIAAIVARRLPSAILPELSVVDDYRGYFVRGMAALTAERIFGNQ